MAGRPPTPVGTHGKITKKELSPGVWEARTRVRDLDGESRLVSRRGSSGPAAERNLKRALAERNTPQDSRSLVTGDTRLKDLVELWFAEVLAAAEAGDRSPNTPRTYRSHVDNQIIPALGELRVKEATAGRLDLAIDSIRKNKSPSVAKTCRSILSGVMGLAVRHGAMTSNPMREIRRITGSNAKGKARSLTIEECTTWLQRLEEDPVAVRRDLPDLTRWFLATGVRMGEAIAVDWSNVDLEREQVDVDHKIIRVKGEGLVRVPRVKSSAGHRTLPLPLFAVEMLRRRLLTGPNMGPLFPDSIGGWRDPSNTSRDLRDARGSNEFGWVTSHVFRKTCATILDESELSAREIADQLGHVKVSMTQDNYLGRRLTSRRTADALQLAVGEAATRK